MDQNEIRVDEEGVNTKVDLQKFNIFSKKISFQLLFLSIWIFVFSTLMYYLIYQQAKASLIELNIFPKPLTWILWISAILIPINIIILYLAPFQNLFMENKIIVNQKSLIYQNAFNYFQSDDFIKTKNTIESYLNQIHERNLSIDKEDLLSLLHKSHILLIITRNITQIKEYIENHNKKLAFNEYQNSNGFLNHHLDIISESTMNDFDNLLHLIQEL